ncbi:hypothetical protein PILCRDRAFT_786098 [Piloderma croceum F 1598]|uniref:SET domain-containing protein n=1 Tax=Piloderma croceum (strain F 1598) TaxID=765440 RepID=A0A0C3B6R9_PILCF|nr:hypothetical protein PILCRDRAFT_786098 [Piloderma croceum F 1598]
MPITLETQFTRFLNHSCEPNCMVTLCYINEGDKDKPLVTIFTQQDVEPWGELSFCYSGITDEDIAVSIIFVRALKLRYLTF